MLIRLEILAIALAMFVVGIGLAEWHGHHRGWDGGAAHEAATIEGARVQAIQDLAALQARVAAADNSTLKIDYQFKTQLAAVRQVQVKNVQDQETAIQAEPSLVECRLPDALVRLRQQQVAASAAVATGAAQTPSQ